MTNTPTVGTTNTFVYNPYSFQTGLGYDDDYGYLDFASNPMSMDGSIFSNGFGTPLPMPMMGMGSTPQDYYNQMREYQRFNTDFNVEQAQQQRNAEMRINASMEGVKGAATVLKDKIMHNEQDQIEEAYNNYVKAVGAAYGEGTPQEIAARAKNLYAQMNGGKTIVDDLREYGHSSLIQGFLHSLSFGTYDRHSAEDNISTITGAPVGTGEKSAQNIGRIGGSAVIGGTIYGIASKVFKSVKAGKIGLIAGLGALAMSFITGKVTT